MKILHFRCSGQFKTSIPNNNCDHLPALSLLAAFISLAAHFLISHTQIIATSFILPMFQIVSCLLHFEMF